MSLLKVSRSSSVSITQSPNTFSALFCLKFKFLDTEAFSAPSSPCVPLLFLLLASLPSLLARLTSLWFSPLLFPHLLPYCLVWHQILSSPRASSNLLHWHWEDQNQSFQLHRVLFFWDNRRDIRVEQGLLCIFGFFKDLLQSWGWIAHGNSLSTRSLHLVSVQSELPLKKLCFCWYLWKTSKNHSEFNQF